MFTKIKNQTTIASCALVFFTSSVHAITIGYSDLPAQINNDFAAIGCTTDCIQETNNTLNSRTDLSYLSAFTIDRDGQESYLIRYNLDSASKTTEQHLPLTPPYAPVEHVNPLLGYAWLEIPRYLDPVSTNTVRLYTDQITNFNDPSGGGNESTWLFGMGLDDIISGSASITQFGNAAGPDEGTLQLFDFLTPCVECDQTVTLNLIGMRYSSRGNQLFIDNAADERASLFTYSQTSSEFSINDTINLSVQAVPVPASLWLFGSGIIALFGLIRRKKT